MQQEGRLLNSAEQPPRLSIVIPVLNEAAGIEAALTPLQPLRVSMPIEVIVVDGGSDDDSACIAAPLADRVLSSPAGRALQMNLGAQHGKAPALLFLHADTILPDGAIEQITQALYRHAWGRFDIELSGRSGWLPIGELDDESALPAYRHRHRRSGHVYAREHLQGSRWLSRTATDGRH